MAIEKRGEGKWRFTVSRNGQTFRKMFYGTDKEAAKAHRTFIVDVERGEVGLNESMKYADLAQLVMNEYVKISLRYRTQEIYKNAFNKHILNEFGSMKIGQIKTLHIQKFANTLAKSYKPNHIDNIMSVLNMSLKKAVEWQLLKESPYSNIVLPKDKKKNTEILSMGEIKKLFELYAQEDNLLHKSAFALAVGCGLRNSEIRALTLDDIDFKTEILTINKQDGEYLEDGKKVAGNVPTKTETSDRKVYMPDFVMTILKEYISSLPYTPISKQIYFNPITGKVISKHCLSKRFTATLRQNNLPSIRFHDLRHVHATLMIGGGVNAKALSARMGHSKVDITLNTYTHVIDEIDKANASTFDTVLENIKGAK